jgi:ankyrin repeat protein
MGAEQNRAAMIACRQACVSKDMESFHKHEKFIDWPIEGSSIMHAAIHYKNLDIVKHLIMKGFKLENPPSSIDVMTQAPAMDRDYRPTPYIIQAITTSSLEIVRILLAAGCTLDAFGHIGFSASRRNAVSSNVLGAAAYHNKLEMIDYILGKVQNVEQMINVKAVETANKHSDKSQFKYENNEFTPLQLAIVAKQNNFKIVKTLLSKGATTLMKVGSNQDTVLHLAAKYCKEF